MEEEAKSVLGGVLKLIKIKADLSPKPSAKEERIKRKAISQIKKEEIAIVVSSRQSKIKLFDLMPGKHISIYPNELSRHQITLGKGDFEKSLGKLVENRILKDFVFVYSDNPRQAGCYKLILSDDFEAVVKKYEKKTLLFKSEKNKLLMPKFFEVSIHDREIKVNNYTIAKPYPTGKNLNFLEYIYEMPDILVTYSSFPEIFRKTILKKRFTRILNDLGFKGEILKAFFPKRSKSSVLFRKRISSNQLKKEGMRIELLIRQLEATAASWSVRKK